MKWVNFLHLYQPPTQTKEIVDAVTKESYKLIIQLIKSYPDLTLTLNISGSLLELWEKYGHKDIIDEFKSLAEIGRVELVGSAMYHPILPLIPIEEVKRQIILNNEISKKFFGTAYNPKGFYIPEMAYSQEIGMIIKEMGFEWIILDEIHTQEKPDPSIKYSIENVGLHVIFRNSLFSRSFPPELIFKEGKILSANYLITAHDCELYGHWHKNDYGFYEKAFANPEINFISASNYLHELQDEKTVAVQNANWESLKSEIEQNIPYAIWQSPNNAIQNELWELAKQATLIVSSNPTDPHVEGARKRLDRGLSSCAWWWASKRRIGPYSPVSWNPSEIEKGAIELLESVRTMKIVDPKVRIETEKLFTNLHDKIWSTHWSDQSKI